MLQAAFNGAGVTLDIGNFLTRAGQRSLCLAKGAVGFLFAIARGFNIFFKTFDIFTCRIGLFGRKFDRFVDFLKLKAQFFKSITLSQTCCRWKFRTNLNAITVPPPKRTFARHQPLPGFQRFGQPVPGCLVIDNPDLPKTAVQQCRTFNKFRQRLNPFGQGRVIRAGIDRRPVHRRIFGIGCIKVFAKCRSHSHFKTAGHRKLFDHRRELLIGTSLDQTFKCFDFGHKPCLAAFNITKRIARCGFGCFQAVFTIPQFGKAHLGFFDGKLALLAKFLAFLKRQTGFFKGIGKIGFNPDIIKACNRLVIAFCQTRPAGGKFA